MTDPRDLIQRLLTVLGKDYAGTALEVEARAYLATTEPAAGPTLDDILELCAEHEFMLGIDGANEEESANGLLEIARAVLARWGTHALQPIPISDRLPEAEHCAPWPYEPEAKPWCWFAKQTVGGWMWAQFSVTEALDAKTLKRIIAGGGWTHWLPHWAIPVPQEQP